MYWPIIFNNKWLYEFTIFNHLLTYFYNYYHWEKVEKSLVKVRKVIGMKEEKLLEMKEEKSLGEKRWKSHWKKRWKK